MESTTDFDLQELESRLYSQVFHSTENWDTPLAAENSNLYNFQTRHVSPYAVSNKTVNGNRYWDAKNNMNNEKPDTFQNNDNTISKEITLHQQDQSKTTNIVPNPFHDTVQKENSAQLDSIIPLENTIAEEYRTKPLKYKSFFIPTTLRLPRSKAKKLPQYIIKYFSLNSKESKKRFRSFLRFVEKSNNNNKHDSEQNESQDITVPPPKITITANGVEKNIELFDIPIPVHDDKSNPLKVENMNNINTTEIITLSDSDSDSVIEIPLPPIPVYNVCSSDSEAEELDNSHNLTTKGNEVDEDVSKNEESAQENLIQEIIDKHDSVENSHNDEIQIDEQDQLHNTGKNNTKKRSKNKSVDMNISFTQLEKERDEFLFTPDSNTNDFLEHDVSNLSKNNLSFNFGLHSSDLDLTKDREESVSKSGPSANDQDLYETESSCSEMGSVISKTRPAVFNEINFESPIKDIFCEPDLSKFSNFITPNRMQTRSKSSSKVRSNLPFTPVKTKACDEKLSKKEENKGLTRSDSSEYHSDPTTLKVKKKNKKAKKKSKKKEKQLENTDANSELCLPLSEDAQVTDTNLDQISTSSIALKEANENNKSLSSKQIENLKFGPSTSTFNDIQHNSVKTSIFNSSTKEKQCDSPTDYYVDTYFADDCLLLEELEQKNTKPGNSENNTEVSNSKENTMKESVLVNTKKTQILPSDNNDNQNLNFSFIDTWRKSTDKNYNKDEKKTTNEPENEVSPNKKLKADYSPTVHPYVVTIISSDEESNASETSTKSDNKKNSRSVNIDDNCPDLIVVNVKNDFASKSTPKNSIVANPFSFVNTYLQNQEKKSFKDYWTNDMTRFYDESWGQENFDMDRIQSSMSRNTSDWKIIPDDIYTISRKRRGPLCLRCREFGHTQYNCTKNGPIKCSTCGIEGHSYTRCPNSICTTCRNPTNHYTTSCRSCSHFRTILCSLCNNVGHEVKNCPDLWRRYHLTTESHTELQTSSSVLKAPSERWCANCAKKGHCDDKCSDLRHEHFPTTPGIISYVPTYDDVFKLPVTAPSPNIPMFKNANVTVADLRTIKKNVIQDSNKKYMNILKQLRQQCNKYDTQVIDQIDRLRRNMNNQEFTRKKIQEIYKIRARVEKYKIS